MNATEVKPETVKDLPWERVESRDGDYMLAVSIVGKYRVYQREWHCEKPYTGEYVGGVNKTIEEGQASAQADYAARILSALVPSGAGAGFAEGVEAAALAAEDYEPDISHLAGLNDFSMGHEAGQVSAAEALVSIIRALAPTPAPSVPEDMVEALRKIELLCLDQDDAAAGNIEDIYSIVTAALRALPQPTAGEGWQPGDTAPTDGTHILGAWKYRGGQRAGTFEYGVVWFEHANWREADYDNILGAPDLWQPVRPPASGVTP